MEILLADDLAITLLDLSKSRIDAARIAATLMARLDFTAASAAQAVEQAAP